MLRIADQAPDALGSPDVQARAVVLVDRNASLAAVMACSDPPAKPPPAGQGTSSPPNVGSGGGEAGSDARRGRRGGEAGVCNDLVNDGTLVDRNAVPTEPPVATGGTVEDGTYDLTDYTLYVGAAGVAGPTGITAKATIRIAGGKIDEIIELAGTGKTATTTRSRAAFCRDRLPPSPRPQLCPTCGGGKQRAVHGEPPAAHPHGPSRERGVHVHEALT